jgi:site-specific recombinase XerD
VSIAPEHALSPAAALALEESIRRLEHYASTAWAHNTVRAYRSDWRHFSAWCADHGCSSLPASAETVGLYLGAIAPRFSLATLERRLASVGAAHKESNLPVPTTVAEGPLHRVWRGIVREKTRSQEKAEPLLAPDMRLIVQSLPREPESGDLTIWSYRDRALLLLGWAGAMRRSELVSLTVGDVTLVSGEGMNLHVRVSKTDQEGRGLLKGIPFGSHVDTCPVTSVRTWTQMAGIRSGPLFRRIYKSGKVGAQALSPQTVSLILKEHAARVGLPPERFSAHSLRSGFITQAIRAGKPERRVKDHSGHRSWEAFHGYVKQAGTFEDNPGKDIGL